MNIAPVSYRTISMKSSNTNSEQKPVSQPVSANDSPLKFSPAAVGVLNGVTWGVLGFAFDRAMSGLFKMGTSIKTSACINGIIGLGMGIYGYFQARKAEKSLTAQNTDNKQNINNTQKA